MSLLSPRSQHLLKQFMIGGAAVGGSAALGTSLAHYLRSLKAEGEPDTAANDDTIYLNLRGKGPMKQASVGGGIALAGGVLSAAGSYGLIRHWYKQMRKKQLQGQLDDAQQVYLDTLGDEADANKAAAVGKPMGALEGMTSMPVATALLLGLATAAVTNRTLDKAFPVIKPPNQHNPKRVVIRNLPPAEQAEQDIKEASADFQDAQEFMLRMALTHSAAAELGVHDIVKAASRGYAQSMELAISAGFDAVVEMVKGASAFEIQEPYYSAAISHSVRAPGISPSLLLTTAASYHDMAPALCKMARAFSEETLDNLCGVAAVMGVLSRHSALEPYAEAFPDVEMDKEAGMGMPIQAILAMLLMKNRQGGQQPQQQQDPQVGTEGEEETVPTQLAGNSTLAPSADSDEGENSAPKVITQGGDADHFEAEHKDEIDRVLDGPEKQ